MYKANVYFPLVFFFFFFFIEIILYERDYIYFYV